MTSATAGLAFSRASSPAETVAASELISRYGLTWVACTWRSSLIIGAWLAAIIFERATAAWLPTCAAASWLFMITITCLFTFCDSCAASAVVIGCCAKLRAADAVGAAGAAAAVLANDWPATRAGTHAAAINAEMVLVLGRANGAPPAAYSHARLIPGGGLAGVWAAR